MFRTLCLILSGLLLTVGCGSSQPTSPAASATPSPAPAPENPSPAPPVPAFFPVPEINTIYLAAPVPPSASTDPLGGRYTLDITVTGSNGFRCESLPDYAKRRTYTADIANLGDHYAVMLYDARFLRDASNYLPGCSDRRLATNGICHQFVMYREGAFNVSASIVPEDEGGEAKSGKCCPMADSWRSAVLPTDHSRTDRFGRRARVPRGTETAFRPANMVHARAT